MEKSFQELDFRSERLDIYANDEIEVNYNVEAQNKNEGNLPKRSRYHQAEMDVSSLKPRQDFNDLKPGYVIFICTFDPFGKKLYRYTFEERSLERDFPLGDETKKIFLSTRGENRDEVPTELIHFLEYMENSTDAYVATVTEKSINRLHNKITELKKERAGGEVYDIRRIVKVQRERWNSQGNSSRKSRRYFGIIRGLWLCSRTVGGGDFIPAKCGSLKEVA